MVDDITIIVAYLNIDTTKQKYNQKPMDQAVNQFPVSPPSGIENNLRNIE